jgi:hypothetical protein
MENVGARKISACENPYLTDIIQLKHAAEEHRHAFYLKKQIAKVDTGIYTHYQPDQLLAPIPTKQYLHQLDIASSRYLKEDLGITGEALKYAAYLYVTYAIEVRADALYPEYQDVLSEYKSKVMVRSIIVEEEGHLEEMIAQLSRFDPQWQHHAANITAIEAELFDKWIHAVAKEVKHYEQAAAALA